MTSIKGIVFSCFDLLHAGHITMLEECKEKCNYLIAGLHTNPAHKEDLVQSVYERYVQLKGCKYVDEIIPYSSEKEVEDMLLTLPLDFRFLGEEYKLAIDTITGYNICIERKIHIHYCKRKHHYSSSELKERIVSLSDTIKN